MGEFVLRLKEFNPSAEKTVHQSRTLKIISEALIAPPEVGILNKANAPYVLKTLDKAIRRIGRLDAPDAAAG